MYKVNEYRKQVAGLPALSVVALIAVLGQAIVEGAGAVVLARGFHVGLLRVLLEVGDVMRSVASGEHSVVGGRSALTFPSEAATEGVGELVPNHLTPSRAGGEGTAWHALSARGRDVLSARTLRDGVQSGLASSLHHKRGIVRIVGRSTKVGSLALLRVAGDRRGRLRVVVTELPGAFLAVSETEGDERAAGGQVDLGVDPLEVLVIDRRLAAVFDGVLPVGRVVVVVNGRIVILGVGFDGVVVVRRVGDDPVAERGLLLLS